MSDSAQDCAGEFDNARSACGDDAVSLRIERQRALLSSWNALTALGLASSSHHINATNRALSEELANLAMPDGEKPDDSELHKIDSALGVMESEIRVVAREISSEALEANLPQFLQQDRRGARDLLDLMLSALDEDPKPTARLAATLGYLISLLCSDADNGDHLVDPITLSPRIYDLCERDAGKTNPAIAEIEAALLMGCDRAGDDPKGASASDVLHAHRHAIAEFFFVPRILRAFVACRTAQNQQESRALDAAQPEESAPDRSKSNDVPVSVFETRVLPELAQALCRRMAGGSPNLNAIDRVAWCVDLAYPTESERAALGSKLIGSRADISGTTILVGLLCRSAVVLAEELEPIGIAVKRLTEDWVKELDIAIQRESNRLVLTHYKRACELSELRAKFLFFGHSPTSRKQRTHEPAKPGDQRNEKWEAKQFRKEARRLVEKAVGTTPQPIIRPAAAGPVDRIGRLWRGWPHAMRRKIGTALAILGLLAGLVVEANLRSGEMQNLDRDTLDAISLHLASCVRSGRGTGSTFVGELDPSWLELGREKQTREGQLLVAALRAEGAREVMVYDPDRVLRIQALGAQAPHIVVGD